MAETYIFTEKVRLAPLSPVTYQFITFVFQNVATTDGFLDRQFESGDSVIKFHLVRATYPINITWIRQYLDDDLVRTARFYAGAGEGEWERLESGYQPLITKASTYDPHTDPTILHPPIPSWQFNALVNCIGDPAIDYYADWVNGWGGEDRKGIDWDWTGQSGILTVRRLVAAANNKIWYEGRD